MLRGESLPCRALLEIAERRPTLDALSCRLVLAHLQTSTFLQATLQVALKEHHLTESQFAILVVLFVLEPDAVTTALLAQHTALPHSAVRTSVTALESAGFVARRRPGSESAATDVQLTNAGGAAADRAIHAYLLAATRAVKVLPRSRRTEVLDAYGQLQRRFAPATSTRPRRS
jgi:DNA-binding MarR family transcriptional regulator